MRRALFLTPLLGLGAAAFLAAAVHAAPAISVDAGSFRIAEPGSQRRAEAARSMVGDVFDHLPAGSRARVQRLELAWGAGATEPVAYFRGTTLILQFFWDETPSRRDVDFALGCAFSGPRGRCVQQGD